MAHHMLIYNYCLCLGYQRLRIWGQDWKPDGHVYVMCQIELSDVCIYGCYDKFMQCGCFWSHWEALSSLKADHFNLFELKIYL